MFDRHFITRIKLLTHPRRLVTKHEITAAILRPVDCRSAAEFSAFSAGHKNKHDARDAYEMSLLSSAEEFRFNGYCAVCNMRVGFLVDYRYSELLRSKTRKPYWRERLVCPNCGLNNRMRASVLFIKKFTRKSDVIYLTEQTTHLFHAVRELYPQVIGSEFLQDGTARGMTNRDGIRHEDATALTFKDNSLDVIASFEVLEHIPDYRRALAEFRRCLRPGGTLIMTVPFQVDLPETRVRAVAEQDGSITHLHPPEYHGDPLASDGILCFYNFGWNFLDDARDAGFSDAWLSFYWSKRLGHLGGYQFVITARKPVLMA
jgi:SAM-dependent methyltransferase